MGESGLEGAFEMTFDFLSEFFSRKWVGVRSINEEFEDLSIDNKFKSKGARSSSEHLLLTPQFISASF